MHRDIAAKALFWGNAAMVYLEKTQLMTLLQEKLSVSRCAANKLTNSSCNFDAIII
jgi:hypothetical protein